MGKIAIYFALGLVLIVVIIITIGALLPKKHLASRAISLRRSPNEVFLLISDFQSAPSWRHAVQQITILPTEQGHLRYMEKSSDGTVTMEVRESHPPSRLVTEIADKSLPYGGFWIFDITPTPDGCTLQITERGEVYNPFFRFVSHFILGYQKTMDGYLADVANHFHEQTTPANANPASL